MLVGPSKSLKQAIQIELNRVKNPNWQEENQLAIYKHGREFELETTAVQVRRSNHSAMLPPIGQPAFDKP